MSGSSAPYVFHAFEFSYFSAKVRPGRTKLPSPDEQQAWLPGDALAPSLVEVLGAMGRDAAPVILANAEAFETWADGRPADLDVPPRAVGIFEARLRGLPVRRGTLSYLLYSVQRVLDTYRGLAPAARKAVDEALVGTGWEAVLAYEPRHRLTKRGFELVFEE